MKRPNSKQDQAQRIKKVTLIGMFLNLFLAVIKVIAGYFGKSQSIIADGVHSLSDCSTDIAVLIGLKYWNQPPDHCHPFGHRRIETIVAVFIGIILLLAGIGLGYEAITKFRNGCFQKPEWIAFYAAIASIIVKEILFQWTVKVAHELKSPALEANAWHHRSDAISSVAVAFAIGIIRIYPNWAILDPVAALAVGIFIIQAAISIIKPSLSELTDAGATKEQLNQIEKLVLAVEGVESIHALRTRFHGPALRVDLHIQVNGNITVKEGHEIASVAKYRLLEKGPDIIDVLIHIEPNEH
jgi:cation diffusion facilitator family transporter